MEPYAGPRAPVVPVEPVVYLNGRYLPLSAARVPVLDRGFLFGDGVYEVIPVYGGCPFRLEQHLARLDGSLAGIRLANPLPPGQWRALVRDLLAHNPLPGDQAIYLQVTRGPAPRDHRFPARPAPTVFAMTNPVAPPPSAPGVSAVTLADRRWDLCQIKAVTLLANVLARQEAADLGAAEAILVRDGWVIEGSSSNVFVVVDDQVVTPPRDPRMLTGITRDLVLELLAAADKPVLERGVSADELSRAREVWITSSTREVVPVVRLDGAPVGSGEPGPRWREVSGLYQACKARFVAGCRDAGA